MKHVVFSATVAFALGTAAVAAADSAGMAGKPSDSPLSAAMSSFIGRWTCPGGPPGQKTSTAEVAYVWDLANLALRSTVEAPASGKVPAYHASSIVIYNTAKKTFMRSALDVFGGWDVATSPGWSGNAITWTEISGSGNGPGHSVTTKNGTDAYDYDMYQPDQGVVKHTFHAHCVKVQ